MIFKYNCKRLKKIAPPSISLICISELLSIWYGVMKLIRIKYLHFISSKILTDDGRMYQSIQYIDIYMPEITFIDISIYLLQTIESFFIFGRYIDSFLLK